MHKTMCRVIQNALALGMKPDWIVEHGGAVLAGIVIRQIQSLQRQHVLICVENGFYGGIGLAAARHLSTQGCHITILAHDDVSRADDPFAAAYEAQMIVTRNQRYLITCLPLYTCGTLRGKSFAAVIDALDPAHAGFHLTDLFSDILISIGHTEELLSGARKISVRFGPYDQSLPGETVIVEPLGLPWEAEHALGPGDILQHDFTRAPTAQRGDHGSVLVVGGSREYGPAPWLSGMAALRTGIDWVGLLVPERAVPSGQMFSTYLYADSVPGDYLTSTCVERLQAQLKLPTHRCALVGPGLSDNPGVLAFLPQVIEAVQAAGLALVLDARALQASLLQYCRAEVSLIVTPNKKEFTRLFDVTPSDVLAERIDQVQQAAQTRGMVIVLKGSYDIIADGTRYRCNYTGNPAMTVAGAGDVLAGMIAGFLAQGLDPFDAACMGCYLCGAAGDLAFATLGLTLAAPDIVQSIPEVMRTMTRYVDQRMVIIPSTPGPGHASKQRCFL